jgi:archaellum component FlaC
MTTNETQLELNKQCITQHEGRINAMEKHIETANHEMGELRDGINIVDRKVEGIKTDVDWLKRTYWIVAGASIGGLVTGIINILSR